MEEAAHRQSLDSGQRLSHPWNLSLGVSVILH
jgi:hypothetical protein